MDKNAELLIENIYNDNTKSLNLSKYQGKLDKCENDWKAILNYRNWGKLKKIRLGQF